MPLDLKRAFSSRKPKAGQADPSGGSAHWAWVCLAIPLILLNPLVVYLRFHQYDLLQPESLLCMAILAAVGLALAGIAQIGRRAPQFPLIVLALAIFADITWTEPQRLALFHGLALGPETANSLQMMAFPLMLAAIAIVAGLVKDRLAFIVTVVFGVMLASSLVLPQSPGVQRADAAATVSAPPSAPNLPTIVHIILDEQTGVEGLPPELPQSQVLREELMAFYLERDFTFFGRTFSHYYMTADSVPNLLNGSALRRRSAYLKNNGDSNKFILRQNAWFDRLVERGYRIKVFQTDYLDYCDGGQVRPGDCETVPTIVLGGLMEVDLSAGDKSKLIFENFLQDAFLLRVAARIADGFAADDPAASGTALPKVWHWRPRPLTSLSAMALTERFRDALREAQPGTVYFAHLLLPHHALIYDRDCRTAADLDDWMNTTDALLERTPIRNDAATRVLRYERYFEQVRCTHLKLAELLDALRAAGRLEDAIVIVHGDHGARISQREPLSAMAAELSDDDIRDNYATHLAIRMPALAPGYRRESRSIQALFAELLLERPLADESFEVFLNQSAGDPGALLESRPMVAFPPEAP